MDKGQSQNKQTNKPKSILEHKFTSSSLADTYSDCNLLFVVVFQADRTVSELLPSEDCDYALYVREHFQAHLAQYCT